MSDAQKTKPARIESGAESGAETKDNEAREAEVPETEGAETASPAPKQKPGEIGGPQGPEPTRYGDWEVGGRCTDF